MTIDEEEYICQHIEAEPELLQKLQRYTNLHTINPRMAAGHIQGRILKMLCRMVKPKKILELGTFTGYSALCWAEGLDADGHIDTIEINDELEDNIRKVFAESPYGEKITLHIGDACEVIPTLGNDYDLVFIDADKRLYSEYFEMVLPKVKQGGFILADNTLWGGKLLQPLQHGDQQTRAILAFNNMIANDSRIEKVILPMRDGLTIMQKK
ncbi:MAG: O-methyltransferase [Paludibacteraceae bacterium]|nr:O-methyltransferase [Paludibacteraceae bacterium]